MLSNDDMAIGRVIKGSKDGKGRVRKIIEVREDSYDKFEFGDWVSFKKVDQNAES